MIIVKPFTAKLITIETTQVSKMIKCCKCCIAMCIITSYGSFKHVLFTPKLLTESNDIETRFLKFKPQRGSLN